MTSATVTIRFRSWPLRFLLTPYLCLRVLFGMDPKKAMDRATKFVVRWCVVMPRPGLRWWGHAWRAIVMLSIAYCAVRAANIVWPADWLLASIVGLWGIGSVVDLGVEWMREAAKG